MHAPSFREKMWRTRTVLLKNIYAEVQNRLEFSTGKTPPILIYIILLEISSYHMFADFWGR